MNKKTWLITGTSTGFGKELAIYMAEISHTAVTLKTKPVVPPPAKTPCLPVDSTLHRQTAGIPICLPQPGALPSQ